VPPRKIFVRKNKESKSGKKKTGARMEEKSGTVPTTSAGRERSAEKKNH